MINLNLIKCPIVFPFSKLPKNNGFYSLFLYISIQIRSILCIWLIYFKIFYLLILERGEGKEKEGEKNIDVRLVASCICPDPNRGPNPPPRQVPRPGIEPVTFHFVGQHPINWTRPVGAIWLIGFQKYVLNRYFPALSCFKCIWRRNYPFILWVSSYVKDFDDCSI